MVRRSQYEKDHGIGEPEKHSDDDRPESEPDATAVQRKKGTTPTGRAKRRSSESSDDWWSDDSESSDKSESVGGGCDQQTMLAAQGIGGTLHLDGKLKAMTPDYPGNLVIVFRPIKSDCKK